MLFFCLNLLILRAEIMALTIPYDREIFDFGTSLNWFTDDRIFVTVSQPVPRDIHNIKKAMDRTREIFAGEKYFTLIDSTLLPPMKREARVQASEEFQKLYKGMAVITNNPMARMLANTMFSGQSDAFPYALFRNEEEAFGWLRMMMHFPV